MKEVHIVPVLNGFIVTVGCSSVVFTDIDELCSELKRYQMNPVPVETEYLKKAINKPTDVPEPRPTIPEEGGTLY